MTGPLFDAAERAQLCDLFDELGPQAPTLLAPWTTHDLAAHLVLRERDYLVGRGLVRPVREPPGVIPDTPRPVGRAARMGSVRNPAASAWMLQGSLFLGDSWR